MTRKKKPPEVIVIEPPATVTTTRGVRLGLTYDSQRSAFGGTWYHQTATVDDMRAFLAAVLERTGDNSTRITILPDGLAWYDTERAS